jgi:hypothetical protein
MAHRGNILSLYDNILEQSGGKSVNVGKDTNTKSTIDSYTPSDMSLSDQSGVSKLIKANRELKRDLDKALDELKIVKKELDKANSMLKKYNK